MKNVGKYRCLIAVSSILLGQLFLVSSTYARDPSTDPSHAESALKKKIIKLAKTNSVKIFKREMNDQIFYLVLYKDKNQTAVQTTPVGVHSKMRWFAVGIEAALAAFGLGNAYFRYQEVADFDYVPVWEFEHVATSVGLKKVPGSEVTQKLTLSDSDGEFTDVVTTEIYQTFEEPMTLKVHKERIKNEGDEAKGFPKEAFMRGEVKTDGKRGTFTGSSGPRVFSIDRYNRKSMNQRIRHSLLTSSVFILLAAADLGLRQSYGDRPTYQFIFYLGGHQQTKEEGKWIAHQLDRLVESLPEEEEAFIVPVLPLHFEVVASEFTPSKGYQPVSVQAFLAHDES